MKNVKNYSADSEIRGIASVTETAISVTSAMTTPAEKQASLPGIDEGHKLVRRYSFDDNGGGYSGL